MKILKKTIAMLVTLTLIPTVVFADSSAKYKVGDVLNYTVYTDIRTYINEKPIQSFNIDGYTAIAVEDLKIYGFDVEWDEKGRILNVTNENSEVVNPSVQIPYVSNDLIGKKALPVLYTDIKTYINGEEVESYNIGGKTIINIAKLNQFGNINWFPSSREIKINTMQADEDITSIDETGKNVSIESYEFTDLELSGMVYYLEILEDLDYLLQIENLEKLQTLLELRRIDHLTELEIFELLDLIEETDETKLQNKANELEITLNDLKREIRRERRDLEERLERDNFTLEQFSKDFRMYKEEVENGAEQLHLTREEYEEFLDEAKKDIEEKVKLKELTIDEYKKYLEMQKEKAVNRATGLGMDLEQYKVFLEGQKKYLEQKAVEHKMTLDKYGAFLQEKEKYNNAQ